MDFLSSTQTLGGAKCGSLAILVHSFTSSPVFCAFVFCSLPSFLPFLGSVSWFWFLPVLLFLVFCLHPQSVFLSTAMSDFLLSFSPYTLSPSLLIQNFAPLPLLLNAGLRYRSPLPSRLSFSKPSEQTLFRFMIRQTTLTASCHLCTLTPVMSAIPFSCIQTLCPCNIYLQAYNGPQLL